ncbi:MobQ family relaxase [Adonisia turfae]|uniref:Uncharacterized protein n=1 Tax=Adonisia turfae CCMR0081 TaxID=2292702 RepID=A0A6M0RYR0_9CYAN|nr:MobQ family relaxase [Adonisia turfae]NEZ61033.1 hypothetical protein [Adonisia turfae CCMR0081]
MALYYLDFKVHSRAKSASTITAKAAYRAGEKIYDPTIGETYDYTRKRGVYGSEIFAPDNAPEWVNNRADLWIAIEQKEDASTRRNSAQLAREMVLALPVELAHDEKQNLVREYVQTHFVNRGMIADVAYHDFDSHNPHAHVLLTMREINADGFGKKNRSWNDRKLVSQWREQWASHINRELERGGHQARVDHRSLEEQGIDREPQIHLGPHVIQMEARGIRTEQGDTYRAINAANRQRALAKVDERAVEQDNTQPDREGKQQRLDDERTLIHQWQEYKDRERGSAPAASQQKRSPERLDDKKSKPVQSKPDHYGQFFTQAVRYELGKDYKPPYSQKIDPASQHIQIDTEAQKVDPLEHKIGDLDADMTTALEQIAQHSKNASKQIRRANWFRAHPEHEHSEYWQVRSGYYGEAKREYLKELSRQAEAHGKDAVLTPRIDQDIAIRLRGAGFSWNQIHKAVTEESPVATSLPSAEHQSVYLEQVIRPTLQATAVKELREAMDRDKKERGLVHEQRLDKLGLATEQRGQEVKREREQGEGLER